MGQIGVSCPAVDRQTRRQLEIGALFSTLLRSVRFFETLPVVPRRRHPYQAD
jgi:hypothetical protein